MLGGDWPLPRGWDCGPLTVPTELPAPSGPPMVLCSGSSEGREPPEAAEGWQEGMKTKPYMVRPNRASNQHMKGQLAARTLCA